MSLNECVPVLFGEEQICDLRGEGRRSWEEGLRYEVRMNHMITLESIELSFFTILYLYSFILVKQEK